MGIALVVVGGLVIMTAFASIFGYLTEKRKRIEPKVEGIVRELEQRVAVLEATVANRDERILQIGEEVAFLNKLLDQRKQ